MLEGLTNRIWGGGVTAVNTFNKIHIKLIFKRVKFSSNRPLRIRKIQYKSFNWILVGGISCLLQIFKLTYRKLEIGWRAGTQRYFRHSHEVQGRPSLKILEHGMAITVRHLKFKELVFESWAALREGRGREKITPEDLRKKKAQLFGEGQIA